MDTQELVDIQVAVEGNQVAVVVVVEGNLAAVHMG